MRTNHSRFHLLAAALAALTLSSAAFAAPSRGAVADLLGAIDQAPTQADWQALGDGTDAVLREIAADVAIAPSRRGRAISALAYFPTAETRTWLDAQLSAPDANVFLQRKAAWARGLAFPAEAHEALAPALASEDVQVRAAAARALLEVGTPEARALLAARVPVEQSDMVSALLKRAVPADAPAVEAAQ